MPQKSTRRFFAITSGTVLPLAWANSSFDGLKGAAEDFRECLLAIAFAFKVKAEGKSSDRYRTGSGSDRPSVNAHLLRNTRPVATARGSVTLWVNSSCREGRTKPKLSLAAARELH